MSPLIMFDLDDTLAESKEALTPHMAELLAGLMAKTKVAIVSGGGLPQFLKQVVSHLPANARLTNLYLLPGAGSALYEWRVSSWQPVYEEKLSKEEAMEIGKAALVAAGESGLVDLRQKPYGERVEYRGSSVAFSVFGQQAPLPLKRGWDPDKSKRRVLTAMLQKLLPEYEVGMGGASTLDITKKGVDKAYGINKIAEYLRLPVAHMIYVGDQIVPGGNDEPALRTHIKTHQVSGPSETAFFIHSLVGSGI